MPTGVAIADPRGRLFEAAERVLLRDGPGGLTSRAVTEEAGVAKGVLHRHFADFDLILDVRPAGQGRRNRGADRVPPSAIRLAGAAPFPGAAA